MPSLILRLERLAPEPPAERDDVLRVPEATVQPPAPAAPTPEPPTEAVPPTEPVAARILSAVDVAAAERLTITTSLSRWSVAVAAAHDACFVLDGFGVVVSASAAGIELLGSGPTTIIGRHILEVINLVDLESGAPNPEYAPRITPLVTLESPGLARSLMRVRHADATVVTLDTSSAPIHDVAGELLGSLTFMAPIPAR